jgi:putative intracellular protease/amidase
LIKKSILLILPALDFNEQEYLTINNTLIKNNFKVFIASDAHSICVGKNGLKVKNDISFFNMREANFSALLFIGGHGVKTYWDNIQLHNLAKKFMRAKKIIGTICSATVIVAKAGLLNEINATCFPDDKKQLEREGAVYLDNPVVVSKKFITAQGPASAQDFINIVINELNKP